MTVPRAMPQFARPSGGRAMPQQFARPSHAPSIGNITRRGQVPRIMASPSEERRGLHGRDFARPGRDAAGPGSDFGRRRERIDRIGRFGASANQADRTGQLAGGHRAAWARVLRNPSFAGRSRAGVASFHGHFADRAHDRFADRGWRRRHHLRPFVIGWAGPLFWPYAYDDFVDYTFYPHAYDTFWPYAYDDVYQSMFGGYAYGSGGGSATTRRTPAARGGGATAANLCAGPISGLTDPAIARIAQAVEPDDAQRAALDAFKDAAANALDQLKASCPNALPSTPTGRLAAMHQRLDAMLQAVRAVRPALEGFYQSLNDEQKARFNALSDDTGGQQAQRDLSQACGERASGIAGLPIEQLEAAVRPDETQRAALQELKAAAAQAVELLKSDCPTYRALTPVVRLEAMEQRLDAMLRAVQTVEPALEKFYGALSDEQKERFNRLAPRQA
jgi:ABC-type transporter MlaC component